MAARKIYITVRSKKDDQGRQSFTIQWKSDQIGRCRTLSGYRGSCGFGILDEHVELLKKKGEIVFINKELDNTHINSKTGLLKAVIS
jgi:hypothetical protein